MFDDHKEFNIFKVGFSKKSLLLNGKTFDTHFKYVDLPLNQQDIMKLNHLYSEISILYRDISFNNYFKLTLDGENFNYFRICFVNAQEILSSGYRKESFTNLLSFLNEKGLPDNYVKEIMRSKNDKENDLRLEIAEEISLNDLQNEILLCLDFFEIK